MISDSSGLFITLHSMLATVFLQATILRPMHPRVTEGNNLTLTCINNITDTYSAWETSFDTQRFLLAVSGTNGECTHKNVPIYIYSYCSVSQFNITILKVQNSMYGSTWKCVHAGEDSNVVELFVEDNDCTVTGDGDTAHVYDKLQNAGSDRHYQQLTSIASKEKKDGECTETKGGGKANVYEKLHAAGTDQHYQQLKTVDLMIDNGQHIVYENLRIQCDTGKRNEEDGIQKKLSCS